MKQEVRTTATNGVTMWNADADKMLRDSFMRTPDGKTASDAEVAAFMRVCEETGLSPFRRQIYPVARWDNKKGCHVWSYQTGIDGFRSVSASTGELDGQDGPFWCGPDGVWKEVWTDKGFPVAAKVTAWRKGCSRGFVGIARWDAYVQKDREGRPTKFWAGMPDLMLAKCAEALALRKAFPQQLGGIYTTEEMGQAEIQTHEPVEIVRPTLQERNRPGDAEPVIEVDPDEWTDDQREEAKACLMDFAETTTAAGWEIDHPKIQATLKKFRLEIGDGSYNNWQNRLQLAAERAVKAAPKPSTDTAGDESPLPKPSDLPKSSDSVEPSQVNPESLGMDQLRSVRADLWTKVWKKWDSNTADGRSLQERHRVNRTAKRKEEWTAGLVKDSPEYLMAEIDGLKAELNAN